MLHTLTEDLASFLSEVTHGDLGCRVAHGAGDIGDLYLRLIDQNVSVATATAGAAMPHGQSIGPMDRASLGVSVDIRYGDAGLDVGYRRTARLMENAFASVRDASRLVRTRGARGAVDIATLYEEQISSAVVHTWDIAQALGGLPYQPATDVTQRILRTTVLRMTQTSATPGQGEAADDAGAFACVLSLAGRVR
ncbi:hypothetical protein [Nocardia sp. NPDC060249]|uniref:hypothetical protein n=1 Tax=Nocardia sp. NPDC060249 TaxID=3347082 RepID=UPI003661143F